MNTLKGNGGGSRRKEALDRIRDTPLSSHTEKKQSLPRKPLDARGEAAYNDSNFIWKPLRRRSNRQRICREPGWMESGDKRGGKWTAEGKVKAMP